MGARLLPAAIAEVQKVDSTAQVGIVEAEPTKDDRCRCASRGSAPAPGQQQRQRSVGDRRGYPKQGGPFLILGAVDLDKQKECPHQDHEEDQKG